MLLSIRHTTTYDYDRPVPFALQRLRLIPRSGHGQTVRAWRTEVTGGEKQVRFADAFQNEVELVKVAPKTTRIEIVSEGEVETEDTAGVIGKHSGFTPLWLYQESTAATAPGNGIRQLAARLRDESAGVDDIALLHALSQQIAGQVPYTIGATDSSTTAEMALSAGEGVCQDHSHIMIAAARHLGYPARYVSGYLMMEGTERQDATHAWCEVWTATLGWIGFDVSNGISPDERYVRVAVGRDYADAAPVLGLRQGTASERLHVSLQVQQ